MSDTVREVRSTRLGAVVLAAAVAGACGDDPSLQVAVDHDGIAVASTVVTVYESQTLHCDDIAFSRLNADQLAALAVTEETIDAQGGASSQLSGISRTDTKVVVARGLDAAGKLLTAGCAEQGVIDGRTTLAITTMPAVYVSLVPPQPDGNDPLGVAVGATDASSKSIDGRRVSYTVYGPAGSLPVTSPTTMVSDGLWQPTASSCTTSGLVRLHPAPPSVIGGYAVQVRVEWGVDLPPIYTSLTNPAVDLQTLVPPTGSTKYCAIRVSGQTRRVVCLDGSGALVVAHDIEVIAASGATTFADRGMQTLGADAIAVVSVPSGTDRDVYAVTKRGHLTPLFGAPPADNSTEVCPGVSPCATEVDDVLAVPACGTSTGKLLLHLGVVGLQQVKQMNAHGGGLADFPSDPTITDPQVRLDNAGCVTQLNPMGGVPTTLQVASLHLGRNVLGGFVATSTHVSYNCSASSCTSIDLVAGAGVGFTTDAEPRLIAASVDATGVVLVQLVMTPDAMNRNRLVERARYPAASIPEHLVVGQFDTDGATDLVWNISAKRGTSFEIAYARQVGDQPLEALSQVDPTTLSAMSAGDLTGDGIDDVLVLGQLGSTYGASVAALHTQAKAVTLPTDATCGP